MSESSLEALLVGGTVIHRPRWKGRLAGGNGQHSELHQLEFVDPAPCPSVVESVVSPSQAATTNAITTNLTGPNMRVLRIFITSGRES